MKNTLIFTFLLTLGFFSCKQNADTELVDSLKSEITDLKAAVEQAQIEVKSLQSDHAKRLVHIVWLNTKGDVDTAPLLNQIRTLAEIEEVHNLSIGTFQDLGDKRAMSDYEIIFSMGFDNEEAYQTYQAHDIHLKLKENIGQYLAGPPVTYDYWEK